MRSKSLGSAPVRGDAPYREKKRHTSYSSLPATTSSRRTITSPSILKNCAEYNVPLLRMCRQTSETKASLGSTPLTSRTIELTLDFEKNVSPRLNSSSSQSATRSEVSASSKISMTTLEES